MSPMSDELVSVLARFHREVVLPDIERVVARLVNPRFDEIDGHFGAIYQRFERLESEYQALKAGMIRVEERLDRIEQRLEGLEAEHRDLVAAVHRLDERLSRVEKRIDDLVDPNWHAVMRSELQNLRARLDGLQSRVDALFSRTKP
jgi:chromosome segregation ATPase